MGHHHYAVVVTAVQCIRRAVDNQVFSIGVFNSTDRETDAVKHLTRLGRCTQRSLNVAE